jgi:hypothetical protein
MKMFESDGHRTEAAEETKTRRWKVAIGVLALGGVLVGNSYAQAQHGMDPCAITLENPLSWASGPSCLAIRGVTGHPAP